MALSSELSGKNAIERFEQEIGKQRLLADLPETSRENMFIQHEDDFGKILGLTFQGLPHK